MSEQQTQKKGGMMKKMLPGILVSVVIIGILIYFVDWSVLTEALKNVSWKLFLILFIIQTISFFFRGLSWRVILDGAPSRLNAFFTITEGYLLNLLPLRLGEIGRAVIMGGLIRKSPFYVFSTVIIERVFDLLVTLLLLVFTIPLVGGADFSGTTYYILFAVIIAGIALMFLIAHNKQKTIQIIAKIIKPESKIGGFLLPKIESLLSGMDILTQPKKFLNWLLWILMTWVCWMSAIIIGIHAFFPELPAWAGLFTQGIGALGGAIPSAPAGIGVVEGAYVVALSFFNIDQSSALAFGLVMHAIAIVCPVLWGLIGFSVQGLKFSEVFAGLQHADLSDTDSDSLVEPTETKRTEEGKIE